MKLKELSFEEFTNFQKTHPLSNFYQTINYAMLMAENGYEYDLIGLIDDDENILGASVILLKPIGIKCFYGYAPRGFLIDYTNEYLVNKFTSLIKDYYYNKNVIFIKINPNIPIGEVMLNDYSISYNSNEHIKNILLQNGYKKLKDNLYFEAQLPRFNAFINTHSFSSQRIDKNTKNKIKKGMRKGLKFEKCSKEQLKEFYNIIKNKYNSNEYYYHDLYTLFEKKENIDLFLVSIDYNSFLENSQFVYNQELEKNSKLNNKLIENSSNKAINKKMTSDKILLTYKNDIMEATKGLSDNNHIILAGALVIKHNNMATIMFSGYDTHYKRFAPNYFLHYNLIKYYQGNFDFIDLNGVVGDFNNENQYSGLNRFKLGFKPKVYEYIGEYDLIIEPKSYSILLQNGILTKEFNKKNNN